MNYYSLNSSLSISPSPPSINALKWRFHLFHNPKLHHHTVSPSISCSFPRRRPRPRRRLKHDFNVNHSEPSPSASESRLHMVIDIDDLSDRASLSLRRFLASSEIKFNRFLLSGDEAFRDLRTMITSVGDRKVVISCRPSTLEFFGYLVLWGFVVVFAFRNLVKLGLRLWNRVRVGHGGGVIRRRDRSLGGREVVVARKEKKMDDSKVLTNPLSSVSGTLAGARETMPKSWARQEEYRLPSWWPVSLSPPVALLNKEEHQREANRLIRAILDNRIIGKDIVKDDIMQLRRLCRMSGVRVSIDMINARDSIYRASANFVLDHCSSMAVHSTFLQVDGEDPRQFIAGLADNLGLENIHAARIVSGAVAARTRSCLLQAWALEMQGKRHEATLELSKICFIHQIFPPEDCSPEMEMVARGLEKHLKIDQRESLMDMVVEVCGAESQRSMSEALGLMIPSDAGDQMENNHT